MRILAGGCVVILFLSTPALADEPSLHQIAVLGEAEILLPPDYATIDVGVVTQGPAVSDALAENNTKMNKVIDALRSLGISDSDLHTSEFAVEPKYEKRAPGEDYDVQALRPIVGYFVSNKVTVTVTDMTRIARIIDASVLAGANASGAVEFKLKNPTLRLDQARQNAIANALHKAQILTTAAHMKLGPALSISDNDAMPYYQGPKSASVESVIVTASRMPTTSILPGQIPVTARVTVVYAAR